ncbi:MAG: cysteine--tRNA ligase, partial [Candidatus Aenigmarchaeota archaeon]|nr:cysteine--tRNA ligase [Candidatus Aenigmarchaeota archaeon]
MPLHLYNTLTRKKELFKPINPKEVKFYGCGPTVYAMPHIGNFKSFVMYDTLRRALEFLGYKVKLVMNITDIDDKTIRDSAKNGKTLKEFTEFYTKAFFRGLGILNIKPADVYPKATETVSEMIEMTTKLIETGYAYEKSGSVYYRISSFKEYGKLSKIDLANIKIGASVDVDEYDKENPQDFALLKKSSPEEIERGIFYDSPWGKIRPGWHIECSA